MKCSINDFSVNMTKSAGNSGFGPDLVTFTEVIPKGK